MHPTSRDVALLSLLLFKVVVHGSEVPVATSPIITTVTQTETQLSSITVGTSVSTTTPVLCSDGTCIAISLVSVPIVSTVTILSSSTYVSTSRLHHHIQQCGRPIGMYTSLSFLFIAVWLTVLAPIQNSATTQPVSTTAGSITSTSPSPSPSQISSSNTSLNFSPVSETHSSTLKTSTRSASASQTSKPEVSITKTNSSNGGLSAGEKTAIAIVAILAGSGAILLACWLRIRRNRRVATDGDEPKQRPRHIVPGATVKRADDSSSSSVSSDSNETPASSAPGRFGRHEMEITTIPTLFVKAKAELPHTNTMKEQRLNVPSHVNTGENMRHELHLADDKGSAIAGRIMNLRDDTSNKLSPDTAAELANLDTMTRSQMSSRIINVDTGVPVELLGKERFEKG